MSRPIQPSGIWSESTICHCASSANLLAITLSTGIKKLTPFSFAFAIISFASSNLSGSQRELPIEYPNALVNVYAIPPPTIKTSILSNKAVITPILSDTFAPPKIATNGRAG